MNFNIGSSFTIVAWNLESNMVIQPRSFNGCKKRHDVKFIITSWQENSPTSAKVRPYLKHAKPVKDIYVKKRGKKTKIKKFVLPRRYLKCIEYFQGAENKGATTSLHFSTTPSTLLELLSPLFFPSLAKTYNSRCMRQPSNQYNFIEEWSNFQIALND